MEILRVAENIVSDGIEVTIVVPGDHSQANHTLSITDLSDSSISETTVSTAGGQSLTFYLDYRYDASYEVTLSFDEEIIFEDQYDVVRPYINPNAKGTTASEIADYAKNERLARAIIDSIVVDGFYYSKKLASSNGIGADYLPVTYNAKKLLRLYENNILIFDASSPSSYTTHFELTEDGYAVREKYAGTLNRNESAPNILPTASSDSLTGGYEYRGFGRGIDYKTVLEVGYKSLPSNITLAAEMLIEDIACGKLDYYKRYVSDYNTDQFKIKFDSALFDGTSNIVVDKILLKYNNPIRTLGVL
jgi:hypothetical protein